MSERKCTHIQLVTATTVALLAGPAWAEPCAWTVGPLASQTIYGRTQTAVVAAEGCRLGDQTTDRSRILQTWQHAGQAFQVVWQPRACTEGEDPRIVAQNSEILGKNCPETARSVQRLADSADWPRADKPIPDNNPRKFGTDYQIVMATAVLEVLAALGLLLWLLLAFAGALRLPEPARAERLAWWQAGGGLTLLALAFRLMVPASLSNWYTPTLAQTEIPRAEFYGGGHVALQWLLRQTLPWTDSTLFAANAVLGSLVVPLWLAVLFQRGAYLRTAVVAAGLVAVVPLHVRLSASASEHVLAAVAWMGALLAWQAVVRSPRWVPRLGLGLLAAVLALVTALARIDATVLVVLLAGWVLVADRTEVPPPLPRRVIAALLWVLLFLGLVAVVRPLMETMVLDRGRPLPTWADRTQALYDVPDGLQRLYFALPGWLGPVVGGLTVWGVLRGFWRYPWLTLLCAGSVLAVPLGIGRSPYDFIMMRYYLPVLPLLLLPVALAIEPWSTRRWVAPALLTAVAVLGIPAWQTRYAFQDEYDWLRSRLGEEKRACTVVQVAVSNRHQFNADVDCCLDLGRCPLVAALPEMTFAVADSPAELLAQPGDCLYYYEGAVCSMQATAEVKRRRPAEYAQYMRFCRDLRRTPGLQPAGEAEVTPRGHFDAFGAGPVKVRLWRVERQAGKRP